MLSLESVASMHRTLCKLAKEESVVEDAVGQQAESPEPKPPHPALTAAKRLGAYGAGTGAGYGLMSLAEGASKKFRGKSLGVSPTARHVVPLLTGAAGMGYQAAQSSAFKKIREDAAKRRAHDRTPA
mgnify:CR=1 FL=1